MPTLTYTTKVSPWKKCTYVGSDCLFNASTVCGQDHFPSGINSDALLKICNLEFTPQNNALARAVLMKKVILVLQMLNIIHKRELLFKEMLVLRRKDLS